jgi:phosphate-selective porin OprO and OprP
LPWYDEATEGRGLLHLGAAYSYRDAFGNAHNLRARPDTNFGGSNAYIVNGGAPNLADYQLYGAELALVYGSFSFESEYSLATLNPANGAADQHLRGFYMTTSYFLTGEHRPYRRDRGVFDRVKPFENFFRVRAEDGGIYTGRGAWEVAYRYDYIDMYEMGPTAGLAATHTFGVNWYLTPYTRLMLDWVHADCNKNHADAGNVEVVMARAQVDF